MAGHEIELQSGLLDDVGQGACTAARHTFAGVFHQHGELAETVEVFEAQLQVDDMIRLPGQRHAVVEEIRRRLVCEREDGSDVIIGNGDFRLRVGVVGNRDEALAVEPFAQIVEIVIPLELDLTTVKLRLGGVGEA